jgi:hypothetical protein
MKCPSTLFLPVTRIIPPIHEGCRLVNPSSQHVRNYWAYLPVRYLSQSIVHEPSQHHVDSPTRHAKQHCAAQLRQLELFSLSMGVGLVSRPLTAPRLSWMTTTVLPSPDLYEVVAKHQFQLPSQRHGSRHIGEKRSYCWHITTS